MTSGVNLIFSYSARFIFIMLPVFPTIQPPRFRIGRRMNWYTTLIYFINPNPAALPETLRKKNLEKKQRIGKAQTGYTNEVPKATTMGSKRGIDKSITVDTESHQFYEPLLFRRTNQQHRKERRKTTTRCCALWVVCVHVPIIMKLAGQKSIAYQTIKPLFR